MESLGLKIKNHYKIILEKMKSRYRQPVEGRSLPALIKY